MIERDRIERLKSLPPEKRQLLLKLLQETSAPREPRAIPRRKESGPAPLSFAQQRLWFMDRLTPGNPAYNIHLAVQLEGALDRGTLASSLREIVQRHDVLRTRFVIEKEQPVQRIDLPCDLPLLVVDLQALREPGAESLVRELRGDEARRPFDLERGPLLRALLVRRGPDDHLLLLSTHHAVSDGWSMGNFIREVVILYRAFAGGRPSPLSELPIQYADYAVWQRQWLQGEVLETQIGYWRRQLAGAPALLELPTDRPRPALQSFRGAERHFVVDEAVTGALEPLRRQTNGSLFMVLLAAFQILLSRLSDQTDVVVGSPIAGRPRPELESLIGCFINNLALRADLSGNPDVDSLLRRIAETTLAAYDHQDLPFERLIDELELERDLSHAPLFQVVSTLQNAPSEDPISSAEGPLRVRLLKGESSTAKYDLTLALVESRGRLSGTFEYAVDLFDPTTIERWVASFQRLLAGIAATPQARIGDLPLLGEAERHQIITDWNQTAVEYPEAGCCLHELVERQVARTPEAPAVIFAGEALSYCQLNLSAGRLARRLRSLGIGPESRVGLLAERSFDLVVGLLGILKAGGAYVPLDPTYPRDRLAFLLDDSRIPVVLTQEQLAAALPPFAGRIVRLDEPEAPLALEEEPPPSAAGPEHLAYVIYTSGSTGRPKGAMNTHRAICNRLLWMQQAYGLTPADCVLQKTPFSFDVSVWELFWPLMTGARLVLARPEGHRDTSYLAGLIEEQGITTIHLVPSMLRIFLDSAELGRCRSLQRVIASGEVLSRELQRRFHRHLDVELHNLYGPTEAAVDVTFHACSPEEAPDRPVPIGRPIANLEIFLLDPSLGPVPMGVPGELCIGGVGLARGYLDRPGLTAEKFIPHPLGDRAGARLYRTGDLARFRTDGEVEYLGRIDHQVKIRGFRIELGEIEAALAQHPGVAETVVLARGEGEGDRRLVAYFAAPQDQAAPRVEELRLFLGQRLPDYMIPAAFVSLQALPLNPNGKIDRRALPAPERARADLAEEYVPPRTPEEQLLHGIWARVLGIEKIGVHDNFFALGGDSILSLRVLALIGEAGLVCTLADLFQNQTLAGLASRIRGPERRGAEPARPVTAPFSLVSAEDRARLPAGLEDAYPLAMLQFGMMYHMALTPEDPLYHNVDSWHLRVLFDESVFRDAVQEVVMRHPILRTSFDFTSYGEPLQLVHQQAWMPLEVEDIRNLAPQEQETAIAARMAREKRAPHNFSRPPQLRLVVHARSAGTIQLTLAENHAIFDGWSLHSSLAEIFEVYLARLAGGPRMPAPPLPLTYRDYVALERQVMRSAEAEAYWSETLKGSSRTELPRWPLPAVPLAPPRIRNVQVVLPGELHGGLREAARAAGVPLKSLLLAAHFEALSRISGQSDVITGLVCNGRLEEAGGDDVRGLFLNTLPLRLRCEEGSWLDLARAAFQAEQEMLPFRRYPLAALQRRDELAPSFDVIFTYIHFHVVRDLIESGRVEVLGFQRLEGASFKVAATFTQSLDGSAGVLEIDYDSLAVPGAQAGAIADCYRRVLAAAAAAPGALRAELPWLSEPERHQILNEWNSAPDADGAAPRHLAELLAEQAGRTPEAVAVVFGSASLTYAELDRRADRLARRLRAQGSGPEVLVGLLAERSLELVVGLVATLKGGGVYMPLDPDHPPERMAVMLEDSRARIVLLQEHLRDRLPVTAARLVPLGPGEPWGEEGSARLPLPAPEDLAYVLYTSGSTGRPKGVMIPHRALVNHMLWMREAFPLTAGDAVLQKTPFGFDASIWELLLPLMTGARLVLAEPGGHRDPADLARTVAAQEITVLQLVPSMLSAFLAEAEAVDCGCLRRLFCGGEALSPALRDRAFAILGIEELGNLYGPTECTVEVVTWRFQRGDGQTAIPIGRPLPHVQAHLLDAQRRHVPHGVPAELYIGGVAPGRGYLGRPDLTAERFVPDAWSDEPGGRLYRTGDLARHLPDGTLEYLGRTDHQIKIRGFRVELGEIEAALARHPAIREAAAVVQGEGRRQHLVAFVSGERQELGADALKRFLAGGLPLHMIPGSFVVLEALPLTPNGKADRRFLETFRQQPSTAAYSAPQGPLEETLAGIWSEVLGVDRIGRLDSFFDLGGHSLLMIELRRRMQDRFGRGFTLLEMFQFPTVSAMAGYLEPPLAEAASPLSRAQRSDERQEGRERMRQRRARRQAALEGDRDAG